MGFESAFECHWAEVSSVVARLVGDVDVARDIAQDTFVQLLRRPPSAETPLRPWLVRVAINRAYNELRANRRR
ncbi:MAG: RNA polymerase subunit sigma-24, partial [Chloroflexi bacterium]|nr:RNA polymerase subunit sigma-24 [Chloroflexota bacterium]